MSRLEKNTKLNNDINLNGSSLKISIVVSNWNSKITESLYKASLQKLKLLGVKDLN